MNDEPGTLNIELPEHFTEVDRTEETIASPIPDAPGITERFISFRTDEDKRFFVFYWQGTPARDLGPMSETNSFPGELAGIPVRIVQTDMFMGTEQEVLAVHCKLSDRDRIMAYSPDMTLAEFQAALRMFQKN